MDALAISVGHNSSAVAIRDGVVLGGYEQERFSKKKSDSAFPFDAIVELKARFRLDDKTRVCVSHWFPNGRLQDETKYWSTSTIKTLFPNCEILTLNPPHFTHHDAHMKSAIAFAGAKFEYEYHVFVVDGFGNYGECISVYSVHGDHMALLDRVQNYHASLGLFYQYATAFCGMKMHNHEYKMLAYETHINEVAGANIAEMDDFIYNFSDFWYKMMWEPVQINVELDELKRVQENVDRALTMFIKKFGYEGCDERTKRILTSYFAQTHLENVMLNLLDKYKPLNLVVTGGTFFNVKLNHLLASHIPGKFCAMPLAGDQGAGIGVYQRYFGNLLWPGHLFWGNRSPNLAKLDGMPGIVLAHRDELYDKLSHELTHHGFVNLYRGNMEFGPRALCHTSTLALPNRDIADKINKMNGRTNEMPFALVVTEEQCDRLFINPDKIHKSLYYMIITRDFKEGMVDGLEGGAHYYPLSNHWTCRPQITRDKLMVKLLEEFGPLINTSWNYHGVPIVMSTADIMYTHIQERISLPEVDFKTIVQED